MLLMLVINHERGNKYEMVAIAKGTYPWWLIFVSGKQFMMATVKMMTSTVSPGNLSSLACLLDSLSNKEIPIGSTSPGISH